MLFWMMVCWILAIVPHKSKFEVLRMLPKTFTGAHRTDPTIYFDRCMEIWVHRTTAL